MTPIAYAQNYEDARLLWSALRSSGITGKVQPVSIGAYSYSLVVDARAADRAADLAHRFAQQLGIGQRGRA